MQSVMREQKKSIEAISVFNGQHHDIVEMQITSGEEESNWPNKRGKTL